ncbi:MAG: hypothetical protein QM610_09720 [Chitinophagaceae bacterium]
MPNRSTDELFQLVKSLEKSEKRNFRLYLKRLSGSEDMKSVQLFDYLDKTEDFEEDTFLKKNPGIKKQQLSNIKAHLYRQLLASLRMVLDESDIETYLDEQLVNANILYNKGLYLQSLRILDRIKSVAKSNFQMTYLLQIVIFEKKIEALHITRSTEDRAATLSREIEEINARLTMQGRLSNLSLQLYGWYIKMGHARDEKDVMAVKLFFETNMPKVNLGELNFYEKMYYYQSHCWYYFILQDFRLYFRHAQKWLDLFEDHPQLQSIETGQYIKAFHNLLSAHFETNNYERFDPLLQRFRAFADSLAANGNYNIRVQVFTYLSIARLNQHFMHGSFSEGLLLVPEMEEGLKMYGLHLDRHRILVFYYKIACLYFGSGDNDNCIRYLNKIIHIKYSLRTDLQCYARLLHLIAHYELGNVEILDSLTKSVYRYMAKMKNLTIVEEEIFHFLRNSLKQKPGKQMTKPFVQLKNKLEKYEGNPLEARSFMYLDIIGWLESKIRNIPVQDVIKERYRAKIAEENGSKE